MASFPQFKSLPAEIQWTIWELALLEPTTHFLTMNSGHHSPGQLRRIYGSVPNMRQFGQSLVSLNPSPLSFTASWSRVAAIAGSCYDANKTAVRLHKKELESGSRAPFPLFDAAQDMLVISPIHAIGTHEEEEPEQPQASDPSTPLSFETVDSVGHWRRRYPLVVQDLSATGYLAYITSVAIYWKPEMDDSVVCRQLRWLWNGDACPNLETIYIVDLDCPMLPREFKALKANNRLAAGPWPLDGNRVLAEIVRPISLGGSYLTGHSNIGANAAGIPTRAKLYKWFHCTVQNHVELAAARRARNDEVVKHIRVKNLTAFSLE